MDDIESEGEEEVMAEEEVDEVEDNDVLVHQIVITLELDFANLHSDHGWSTPWSWPSCWAKWPTHHWSAHCGAAHAQAGSPQAPH